MLTLLTVAATFGLLPASTSHALQAASPDACSGSSRADTVVDVTVAMRSGLIKGRVLNVGMPHTGTTTVHANLRALGCCYATHNAEDVLPAHRFIYEWDSLMGRKKAPNLCALDRVGCTQTLLEEASHFQCLGDNPWHDHWRELTTSNASAFADGSSTYVVLTKAPTALHYAISRQGFLNSGSEAISTETISEIRGAMREYDAFIASVRAVHANNPRYFELCLECGDDAHTLARNLRLDIRALGLAPLLAQLSQEHKNEHSEADAAARIKLVRYFADALV
jgi:hypothetical protein